MKALRPVLVCVLAAVVLCVSACGNGDDSRRVKTVNPSPALTDPVTAERALAVGGLKLPPNSSVVTAERMDVSQMDWLEGYRVTFKAPRSNALQFCSYGGLKGALPSAGLTPDEQELLGPSAVHPEGTRICSGSWPDGMAWQRTVAITPGDPATVYVAVTKMGR